MGRPAKFDREQLKAAALALVDEQGLASLSMRTLAAALGTGAMTLYNYVETRQDLEILVVEAVMADVRWPKAMPADWRDEVRVIAKALWQAVRSHPHAIPLILTRRSRTPAVFDAAEALLRALGRSGRAGHELLVAFRAVFALLIGMAQAELAGPLTLHAGESAEETVARFRALPPDTYPRLIDIATAASASSAEAEFHAALDLLIEGLAAKRTAVKRA
jgi:AcrR family transcriptional regulator